MPDGLANPVCILVRHAHAQWPAYRGRDYDRPLTSRGIGDAHATGHAIRAAGHRPARVIASSARRTEQTARILVELLGVPEDCLHLLDSLYNAGPGTLREAASAASSDGASVLVVGHNPGISELARALGGDDGAQAFQPAQWRAFAGSRISSAADTATGR